MSLDSPACFEGGLLAEMAGTLESFRAVHAEVLLLGGSKGLPYLKPSLDALEQVVPHAERVELKGLDHGGSSDVSDTNSGGKPEVVAPELRRFFAVDSDRGFISHDPQPTSGRLVDEAGS
jgi:hypothetical protein